MQNNLNSIICNSLTAPNLNIDNKIIKNIIKQLKLALINNREAIILANSIDIKNNNGFTIDFDIIENIFNIIEEEDIIYGNVIVSKQNKEKKFIYGKQIMNMGTVAIINDGNTYAIIEMILRNILANNAIIFNNKGYMYGTNNLIIEICQSVLEQLNISKYLVQMYISNTSQELLSNFANINLVICIGNHDLQREILSESKMPIIISGYENFELYIEDDSNLDFIKKIIDTKLNINVYKTNEIILDCENAILVSDIDEAIAQINYNGSKYSSAIFTNSAENASKFVKEIHSKIVTINTSPTIERICDIKQSDLVIEKKIIYPLNFNL